MNACHHVTVPSPRGDANGMGDDLGKLIADLGSPLVASESLTTQPTTISRRASWRLTLEDGRVLKGRRLDSAARGAVLEYLSGLLAELPCAKVLARRGESLLEEWVPGPSLESVAPSLDLVESIGLILGRLARASDASPLVVDRMRRSDSLFQSLAHSLDELRFAGALTAEACGYLLKRARDNAPETLECGLVHLDYKPQNIVMTATGPVVIDNELIDHGPLDMDLARTWYLWPMKSALQARFLRGYGRMRSTQSFLLHEVFWAIQTLGCAAAYLHRHGLFNAPVLRALDRLAAGDLPRVWVDGGSCGAEQSHAQRVRLAFICDYLAIGGQERICLELIRGLNRDRFEPFLYAFRGGALEPSFRALGIPVLVGSCRDPLAAAREWTAADAAEVEAYRGTLADALERDEIDAALVFAWRDALPALKQAGVRLVIEKLDGPALLGKIEDKSGVDRVVAESATIRETLIASATDFGLNEDQIECILPGIDLQVFDPDCYDRASERTALGIGSEDFVVGTVGRLIPAKNVALLLRSFAAIDCTLISVVARLLIVGPDGGSLAELLTLADELGVAGQVNFLPATDRVAAILSVMDVFAMTSQREGLPTAILEAMAMALPIVSTGVGSIPEVMQGNGFILDRCSPGDIAQHFRKLLRNPQLRRDMGRQSRAFAARFAIRNSVGRYEDLVFEGLATKRVTCR